MKTFQGVKLNDTHLNLLVSFAWLGGTGDFGKNIHKAHREGSINLMIDSGAFTYFNHGDKKLYKHITLDNYCNYLNIYGDDCEKYVMLDKIGNEEATKTNYEIMLDRGLNPMFVMTMFDNDWDYLNSALNNNPHLCVAGGATTKGEWMTKRFQEVYAKTNKRALMHGLGYITYPKMFQLPLHSVDSSSWAQGSAMFGNINYFDNGIKNIHHMEFLTGKRPFPMKLIQTLEKLKISPKQFVNKSNFTGGVSLLYLLAILAWIDYQKYAKANGIDLFLSIINDEQLQQILYINDEYNAGTLTYEKYKSRS